MRKILPVLLLLAALTAPATASATGNHNPPQPTPPKTCACCADLNQRIDQLELVFNQKIDVINQKNVQQDTRITNLETRLESVFNYVVQVDQRTTQIINRITPLICDSDRTYRFRLRTQVDGVPVASVQSVTVAGTTDRGSFTRNADGRFVITASYVGITAPALQFRTVMVAATLANGEEVDLVQYVRICGAADGDPNDIPAQDRAGR